MATGDPSEDWVGVVLAGGRSTRMGQDKARLTISGERLVDRMARLVREAGARRVLVSGRVEGHECVEDREPGRGPLGGLESVCAALLAEGAERAKLVVVPVDMPLLTSALLRALARSLDTSLAAHFRGLELPLALGCTPASLAAIEGLLRPGLPPAARSVRALLRALGARALTVPGGEAPRFANANTPREWEKAVRPEASVEARA